jgi:hypothetical protein
VSPNVGLRNLISSAYSFGASLSLSWPEAALEAMFLCIRNFVSVVSFPD